MLELLTLLILVGVGLPIMIALIVGGLRLLLLPINLAVSLVTGVVGFAMLVLFFPILLVVFLGILALPCWILVVGWRNRAWHTRWQRLANSNRWRCGLGGLGASQRVSTAGDARVRWR